MIVYTIHFQSLYTGCFLHNIYHNKIYFTCLPHFRHVCFDIVTRFKQIWYTIRNYLFLFYYYVFPNIDTNYSTTEQMWSQHYYYVRYLFRRKAIHTIFSRNFTESPSLDARIVELRLSNFAHDVTSDPHVSTKMSISRENGLRRSN